MKVKMSDNKTASTEPTLPPPEPPAARITLVQNVTHAWKRKVTPFNSGVTLPQLAPSRPLLREVNLSEDSQPIDLTGFESAVLIGVRNVAEEEGSRLQQSDVFMGPAGDPECLVVGPGLSQLIYPRPGVTWFWRAAAGSITVELFAAK